MTKIDSLWWSVEIDKNLVLRVEPIVNGTNLSKFFSTKLNCSPGGLGGLSLGLLDAVRWPEMGCDKTLLLLSCNCGAFDARVRAHVKQDDEMYYWHGLQDSRFSGTPVLDLDILNDVFVQSLVKARASVKKAIFKYALRLMISYRTNELPFSLTMSHLTTLGLIGMLLSYFVNIAMIAPSAALVIVDILFWSIARRYFGYHSVWIPDDGARIVGEDAHANPCPYHPPGISYIQRNWFKAYWQDDGSPIWKMVRSSPGEES